ncbi:MAG: ATP-binding protein [Vulcanimicrobiota bacterium]
MLEREGLQAALVLGTWAYLVLISSHFWGAPSVPWAVWINRLGSLILYLAVYRRFSLGKIRPEHMALWTFALCLWTVASVSFSYVCGSSPYVAVRIAFLMVVAAILGLPTPIHTLVLLYGVAVTVYLQMYYPSPSDPGVNLNLTIVCMLFSIQANRTRRRIFLSLEQVRCQLESQAKVLKKNHQQAASRQASLDSDVAHATADLEETNGRLRQAIDDQIEAFQHNQRLHQQTADLLYGQSLGRAAGAAAHDFNNLLGVISATLEVHEADLCEQPSSRAAYQTIRAEVDRAMVVGRRVLAVSGRQILKPEKLVLQHLLPDWILAWSELAPGLRLLVEGEPDPVCCDPSALRQVLEALIRNAREASANEVEIRIIVQAGGVLRVEDDGPGVSEQFRANLFKPFFTTHSDSEHLGLSLAAVRAVLRQQGGDIHYELEPRAHFCVRLEQA